MQQHVQQCTLVCPIRRPQCNAKSDPAPRWTRSPSGGPSVGDSRGDGSRCLAGPCRGQADRTTSVTPKSPTQRDVLPITAFGVQWDIIVPIHMYCQRDDGVEGCSSLVPTNERGMLGVRRGVSA